MGRRLYEVPTQPLAPIKDSDTRKRLEEQYHWLTLEDSEAASFLFGEVKAAFDVPRLSNYALLSSLAVKDDKARMQFELIESWLEDTCRAEAIAGGKARLLLVAASAIVLGVLSLTVNGALGERSGAE